MTTHARKSSFTHGVDEACEKFVDSRVRALHPPWLRAAHMTLRVGGVLLVLAVMLSSAVMADKIEMLNRRDKMIEKHSSR